MTSVTSPANGPARDTAHQSSPTMGPRSLKVQICGDWVKSTRNPNPLATWGEGPTTHWPTERGHGMKEKRLGSAGRKIAGEVPTEIDRLKTLKSGSSDDGGNFTWRPPGADPTL